MSTINSILLGLFIGLTIGAIVSVIFFIIRFKQGIEYRKKTAELEIGSAEQEAKKIIEEAIKKGETKKREYLLETKAEVHNTRTKIDEEVKQIKKEIQMLERRLQQKEENIEKKIENLEKKENELEKKSKEIEELKIKALELKKKQSEELEKISGLSVEEAKEYLLNNIESEVKHEAAMMIKEIEQRAREDADKKAKNIIACAVQKCAADHASEITVSVVPLPSEDMKGRIIGREGRNIRTFEELTGVNVIIDDTPEAVILSGFDPIRREIAKITLEKLIIDGRIHPARIEEMVEKAKKEVEDDIKQTGENATFETGVYGLNPEIIKLLGRLKFRTSYGQNVLNHSIEVSHLAGLIAAELGVDEITAKRAGLLHDIGKSVDHEMEGSHVNIGGDLAKKYKESEEIVHAILAHHGDIEAKTLVAIIVQAADSISAARPGARKETLQSYVKRLEKLEEIATSFIGVEKCFSMQAGREVRIIVRPEDISDEDMLILARDIVKKIENELDYPGQIKVNVIRETRAIEYAK